MKRRPARLAALSLLALGAAACSDDLEAGRLYLVTGLETDTWSAAPTPVRVEVERELEDGSREPVTTLEVPTDDTLPSLKLRGPVSRYIATGVDADGEEVVRGSSFWLDPDGLQEIGVPLFVGRVGEFSRPEPLSDAVDEDPVLALVGGRFLLAAGPELDGLVRMSGYDFGFWSPTTTEYYTCPSDPCRVESMAVIAGSVALVVGQDWGYVRDFVLETGSEYTAPDALESFSVVAGGASVNVDDGSAYIVGPTRATTPTKTLLRLTAAGDVFVLELEAERLGAAATWIEERGLVVTGGSATAAGAELVAASAITPTVLPFPPDPTTGAALVAFDDSLVMRVGGKLPDATYAPTVILDLSCAEDCAEAYFADPIELDHAQAFHLDESVLVVGEDPEGMTAVKRITIDGVETLPLREPRAGARAIANTLGQVLIVGGRLENDDPAYSIEVFTP